MTVVYVEDLPDVAGVREALARAGFEVATEKTPNRPAPGDLSVVAAGTGITSALRHELNNPLTAVLGFVQLLLRREDLPPDAMDKVRKIHEHGIRVRDLLRRPEGGEAR